MLKIKETIYCIRQEEWEILLAKGGIEETFGLSFQKEEMSKREMLQTLYRMVKKKMLRVEQGNFLVQEPYGKILKQVKMASFGLHVRQKAEKEKQIFAYMGQCLVVCIPARNQRQAFDIQLLEKEQWLSYLWEQKFFPYYETLCKKGEAKQEKGLPLCSQEIFNMYFVETVLSKVNLMEQKETHWLAFGEEDGKQELLWHGGRIDYSMDALASCMKGMMQG